MSRILTVIAFLGIAVVGFSQEPVKERRLLPGDQIRVTCSEDAELCVSRMVNREGVVSLPELGVIGVATLTALQASEKLRLRMIEVGLAASPTVTVTPEYVEGQPVMVAGAVKHPMSVRFGAESTLAKLLKAAQPTDDADASQVEISHADGSFEVVDSSKPFYLADGDRVRVPQANGLRSVEVIGGVVKPCQLPLQGGMSVGEALDAAGGIATRGMPDHIEVIRHGEPIPISFPADSGFQLTPGDQLRVDVRANIEHVVVQGDVLHPGLTECPPGMTLTQAIAAAGGIKENERSDLVCLKHVVNGVPHLVKLSIRFLYSHRIPDPVLVAGDEIVVGPQARPDGQPKGPTKSR